MAHRPDIIPSRGAIPERILMEVTRDLTQADLTRLGSAPKIAMPILQKLRATHHRQASLLAEGKSIKEVAAIVGCTTQRLTDLSTKDSAFMDLVHYYADQIMAAQLGDAARLKDKLIDAGEMAVDELIARLEDDGKRNAMPIGEVRKIAEFALDRTVAPPAQAAPPVTTPASITINFGTPIRPDTSLRSEGEVIEGKAEAEILPEGKIDK